ncbi:unnamed protein product [Somion occarium]|uniref:AB hydrolase-1 domain-containing protein n=1 Tax=Somion occarium TaxID=3059160 RepID=A0ABP1CZ15_9APHY
MSYPNPSQEGLLPFEYRGETFQTYYKVYGDLRSRTRRPLVCIHGGPGIIHDALMPLSDLAKDGNIPVIMYDQLGNGRSTHLKNKPPTFWTIDLFIDELENLLSYLDISDSFDLLGHSWGGILALEFEVRRQPAGLKHIIASNSLASNELWKQSTKQLMERLPESVQEGLRGGLCESQKHWEALQQFHAAHGCTLKPMPKEYLDTLLSVFGPNGDSTVAHASILNNWSIIDRLHLVRVPTLVINGRMDMAQDFVVRPLVEGIQQAKWVTFENSSHTPFLEERQKYMKLVAEFLVN